MRTRIASGRSLDHERAREGNTAGERWPVHWRRGDDTRQRFNTLDDPLHRIARLLGRRILAIRPVQIGDCQPLRPVAKINVLKIPEATYNQPRASQHHHGERHLPTDKDITDESGRAPVAATARAAPKWRGKVALRAPERRDETE